MDWGFVVFAAVFSIVAKHQGWSEDWWGAVFASMMLYAVYLAIVRYG